MQKSKIRITTLTPELVTLEDRLVDQTTEFNLGPKEAHKGPLRLEVTLRDQSDIDNLITYIKRLKGDMPIPERKVYSKKASSEPEGESSIEQFLSECKQQASQKELVALLRSRNFKFVDKQFLDDFEIAKVSDKFAEKQLMIRQLKEAKSPKADKWDPQLIFVFDLYGENPGTIRVILFNELQKEKIKYEDESTEVFKLKRSEFMKFPHYMTHEEREKYRTEQRKYQLAKAAGEEINYSKFWRRWHDVVKEFNSQK